MKKIILLLVFLSCSITGRSQDFSDLASIPLDNAANCKKAEPKVMECAQYLLSNPAAEDFANVNAMKFIMSWMEKTPDFTFELGGNLLKAIDSDASLIARYLASQAKTAINKGSIKNKEEFEIEYATLFLEYCEQPKNNVKLTSKLKKFIKAKNENKLKEALGKA